eukprot:107157-Hanusia_phi.AAC.1
MRWYAGGREGGIDKQMEGKGGEERKRGVRAWSIGNLLDYSAVSSALPSPAVTWSQHTLPVTSVVVGAGGCEARVCSSSLDKTVRIFHIPT